VALAVHPPGQNQHQAEAMVAAAHGVCPYSNATRGNITITITITTTTTV